jgi:hypothetical protein
MRFARLTTALAITLAAGTLAGHPALAEDGATIPGGSRSNPGLQRPMQENPEMKLYAPAPAAVATPPAADRSATAAPPPAAAPVRKATLRDVDGLLRQAETDMAARRTKQAEAELGRAQTELLNAQAAGEPVPQQAMAPLAEARAALRRGRAAEAERATRTAQQVIASAE